VDTRPREPLPDLRNHRLPSATGSSLAALAGTGQQQPFPGSLAFSRATHKSQQVTAAVSPDPMGHQHLHPLPTAGRRIRRLTPSREKYAHSSFKGVLELPHRLIQAPAQTRDALQRLALLPSPSPLPVPPIVWRSLAERPSGSARPRRPPAARRLESRPAEILVSSSGRL
jgi:hypothetical protein